jgi:hypothetical protein
MGLNVRIAAVGLYAANILNKSIDGGPLID